MSPSPLCGNSATFYTFPGKCVKKAQFLYRLPPSASEIGHWDPKTTKNQVFFRSKWMSMSLLCSKLLNFYIVSRPARQQFATATPKPQKPCIFCGQSGCRCRHSAVNCSISISSPAQCVKKWPLGSPNCKNHAFFAVKVHVDVATLR